MKHKIPIQSQYYGVAARSRSHLYTSLSLSFSLSHSLSLGFSAVMVDNDRNYIDTCVGGVARQFYAPRVPKSP